MRKFTGCLLMLMNKAIVLLLQRRKDTKDYNELYFSDLDFLQLCAFVPLLQNRMSGSDLSQLITLY
jgi:hypothetical protein